VETTKVSIGWRPLRFMRSGNPSSDSQSQRPEVYPYELLIKHAEAGWLFSE
jgi:hypothetical protein